MFKQKQGFLNMVFSNTYSGGKQALDNIGSLPKNEQIELLQLLAALEAKTQLTKRQNAFLDFVNHVYTGYKVGAHHE